MTWISFTYRVNKLLYIGFKLIFFPPVTFFNDSNKISSPQVKCLRLSDVTSQYITIHTLIRVFFSLNNYCLAILVFIVFIFHNFTGKLWKIKTIKNLGSNTYKSGNLQFFCINNPFNNFVFIIFRSWVWKLWLWRIHNF